MLGTLLNRVLEIRRLSRVPDGQGGWLEQRVTVGTVRGRIRPASASESAQRYSGAQNLAVVTHVAYLPAGTDVRRDDELVDGNLVVTVRTVRPPSAGHHLEVDAEEVQAGG
ncbi:MAG: head-tail adaptor protein [Bacillota bacterium]